jgi:uncharacterized protein YjdB
VIDFTPLPNADPTDGVAATGTVLTPSSDSTRCAAVKDAARTPTLVVVGCTPSVAQTFTFTAGEIRTAAVDLCITAPDQRDNAVRPVTLEPCNGSDAQQWASTSDGEYRGYRGKCLTAAGPQRRAGSPVAVRGCMGRSDQRWMQRSVSMRRVRVDSIRLNAAALNLAVGTTSKVNAVALDADGHEMGDDVVTWASADPDVATVSPDGTIKAVGGGTTTVVAMSQGRVKSVAVEVRSGQYAGLDSGTPTYGTDRR